MDETPLTSQDSKITIKELNWKWISIGLVALIAIVCLYQFGWKGLTNHFYQKGYNAGFTASENQNKLIVAQQVCQYNQLGMKLPNNCDLNSKETMDVVCSPCNRVTPK